MNASSPSVLHDIFGYFYTTQETSLKRQLELACEPGLNINVILVAREDFTQADFDEIHFGLQIMRDIYAQVDLGIRDIRWLEIPEDTAGDYAEINSGAEAHNLTDDFNGPNGGYLDFFVVRNMTGGAAGWGDVVGPCSKDDKDEMTGVVVSLVGNNNQTGVVFAHEVGHHLGASKDDPGHHSPNANNFMHATVNWAGSNRAITTAQGNEMKSHCYVKDIC
jgi:hypothetical protein